MKKLFFLCLACLCAAGAVQAEEVVIVYTGNSYSSLFDCGHCPAGVGGAVTRRAALLETLRRENPFIAVVDAGNFTAGGILDEFSVDPLLDQKRTELYLSVLGRLGYDALCLGDEDFNFGQEFLRKAAGAHGLPLLSANIKVKGGLPYLIKKYGRRRVAFIGLTNPVLARRLGIKSEDHGKVLSRILAALKKKADVFVLLSNMGEAANKDIARRFPQIKVIIASGNMTTAAPYESLEGTLLCRSAYQGKEVRLIRLIIDDKNQVGWAFEQLPLGSDIAEDESIKDLLPDCFSDNDCRSEGKGEGICRDPGGKNAVCQYPEVKPVDIWVITDTQCSSCSTSYTEDFLAKAIPGVRFATVDFRDEQGAALIRKYSLDTLPSFIVAPEKPDDGFFARYAGFLERRDKEALIKKELSGIFMYLNRSFVPGRLDVFVDLSDAGFPQMVPVLDTIRREKGISVEIHFLTAPPAGNTAVNQPAMDEETARLRAIEWKYPDKFWPYLTQRISLLGDSWWISSFEELGIDHQTIRAFLQSDAYSGYLQEEEQLREALGISHGTAILVDNKMVFQVLRIDGPELLTLIEYASSLPR